jgi:hypothetical protein
MRVLPSGVKKILVAHITGTVPWRRPVAVS